MHELGHNLSLQHGGSDSVNYKANYLSIMSYSFQMSGVVFNGATGKFDYSPFQLPSLDENNLNENVGLNGGAALNNYGTQYFCSGAAASTLVVNANGPIDWNCNGNSTQMGVSTDINNDGAKTVLTTFNDWSHLVYNGGSLGELGFSANLPALTTVQQEVNPTIDAQITKPLAVAITGGGAPQVLPGSNITLTFTVMNRGANNDSYALTASATLSWADFSQVPATISLAAGGSTQITVPVHVPNSAVAGTQALIALKAVSQASQAITDTNEVPVTVVTSGRPTIIATIASQSTTAGVLTIGLQLTNNGPGPADNLIISGVPVRTVAGSGTATLTAPTLPQNLGGLTVGGSTTINLTFNVPSTATRLAIGENGTVQDLSGNVYSYSIGQTVKP
jgi:hypothetical protein